MGKRKPKTQRKQYTRTVSELVISFVAQTIENAKIIKRLRQDYPGLPIGITGKSQGAVVATMTSIIDNAPLALITYIGGFSAECMTTFRSKIDMSNIDMPEEDLFKFLDKYSIKKMHDAFGPDVREGDKRLVARHIFANADRFISQKQQKRFKEFLDTFTVESPVDKVIIKGGHLTSIMKSKQYLVPNIVIAMDKLNSSNT